jgi:hypothetical protein
MPYVENNNRDSEISINCEVKQKIREKAKTKSAIFHKSQKSIDCKDTPKTISKMS